MNRLGFLFGQAIPLAIYLFYSATKDWFSDLRDIRLEKERERGRESVENAKLASMLRDSSRWKNRKRVLALALFVSSSAFAELVPKLGPEHVGWWLQRLDELSMLEETRIEGRESPGFDPCSFALFVGAYGQIKQVQNEMIEAGKVPFFWLRFRR